MILHPGAFATLWEEKTKALFRRAPEDPEPEETSGFLGKARKTQKRRHPDKRETAVPTENGKPWKSLGENSPVKMWRRYKARDFSCVILIACSKIKSSIEDSKPSMGCPWCALLQGTVRVDALSEYS